jgi:hypothetical protein
MIYLLWLAGAAALIRWMSGHRTLGPGDLGSVSEQWVHNHRFGTRQDG